MEATSPRNGPGPVCPPPNHRSTDPEITSKSDIEAMGCFLELPEEILRHICSFLNLTNEEAIRLGLVSKGFLRFVSKRPTLSFDGRSIASQRGYSRKRHRQIKQRYRKEVRYMRSTLTRYHEDNIDLESFTFESDPGLRFLAVDIDCIRLATTKKGLRNLNLSMSEWGNSVEFSVLPVSLFQVESLVQLRLAGCYLQEERILWRNLKRLQLHSVQLAGKGMFDNIIRGNPLIEFLEIFECGGNLDDFNFKLVNLLKLKQLTVYFCSSRQTVEVINPASNLESLALKYPGYAEGTFRLKFPEYRNLRSLCLIGDITIDDSCFDKLWQLEELNIWINKKLLKINISSQSLKKIHLMSNNELKEAEFDVPSIDLFEYKNCGAEIMPELSFKGNNKKGEWISRITFKCYWRIDTWWFVGLHKFLSALNGSETFLDVTFGREVRFNKFEADQMMEDSSSASYPGIQEIREIELQASFYDSCNRRAIVDGIFSICRSQTIKFACPAYDMYELPKQIFDMMMKSASDDHKLSLEVTGTDISQCFSGRSWHFPQTSDSNEFLKQLKGHEWNGNVLTICFNLEWRT